MTPIKAEDLIVGEVYMIVATPTGAAGFVGHLVRLLAVEYGVILLLTRPGDLKYVELLKSYTFAVPSREFLEAAVPNETWPDEIEVNLP